MSRPASLRLRAFPSILARCLGHCLGPLLGLCLGLCLALPAAADPAEIVEVQARGSAGTYSFEVTLLHGDTGWDDYADGWRVELEDGTVIGTRVLYHPHVNEQPFTRSLGGVAVPPGVATVFVRAKTLTDGWGDSTTPHPLEE